VDEHRCIPGGWIALAALSLIFPRSANAASVTVPDHTPAIQAALDSILPGGAPIDTVLVRAGSYPERLQSRGLFIVIGIPDGSGERPVVDGLLARDELGGMGFIQFRDLRFRGGVTVSVAPGTVEFRDCQLDSGLTCELDPPRDLRLVRCAVSGRVYVYGGGGVDVDSCTVRGQLQMDVYDNVASVRHSEFVGPGSYAIWSSRGPAVIEGNRVSGFDRGIMAGSENTMVVRDNVVLDCPLSGIGADFDTGLIEGNRVERCGTGLTVEGSFDGAFVRRNLILDCSGDGIRVVGAYFHDVVDSNVVGRCGGDGISMVRTSYDDDLASVRHNTSFGNAGSGFVVDSESGSPTGVTGNIAYGNGAYGLVSTGLVVPVASCNDWFANGAGAVGGMDSTGTGFSVDPRFCDLAIGDARLRSDSSLLDWPGCGLIGALGVGCSELTATIVTQFQAERTPEGIRLRWQVAPGATAWEIWVERSEDELAWARIPTERKLEGDGAVELDREVRPDRAYHYRLLARDGGGDQVIGSPIVVAEAGSALLGLSGVTPNPSRGPVEIEFRLAHAVQVELKIYDVAGRLVAPLVDESRAPGLYVTRWSGLDARGEPVPPGIYLVRYRQPGVQTVRRIARVR
jgi:hypothetical protein